MSRISEKFIDNKALITFITAGDPSFKVTEKLIYEMEKAGADIIELGVPFSDPLADGPVIQEAHIRALKSGTTVAKVLSLVSKVRKRSEVPLILMLSYNLIVSYGISEFIKGTKKAGVDGLIVPDLPMEESSDLRNLSEQVRVDLIQLIAPTSTDDRIKAAAQESTGFIYLISLLGITGAREKLPSTVAESIRKIRQYTKKPVAVGFGISKPKHVKEIVKLADGVIVGSAIVDIIAKNLNKKNLVKKIGDFVRKLKEATNV
ncbi:MAG: tryptophan synthase subunit alpha [Candidatus Saganbacteria bacterium]|nr:tryptophan synthase subunit alpha [Candidatus Saganbacteria bacterium]